MRLKNRHKIDTEKKRNVLRTQGGFTLIEVLIALTIFAVGLLAIAAMQTSAIKMNFSGNRITELSTTGIDQLENLMSLPYTNPLLAVGGPYSDPAHPPPAGYNVNWTVANGPTTNTRSITLTVTRKGKTLTLTSIRAQSL